jgi:hypothetical protein
VKGGLGQVARHSAHRPAVSFAQPQAEVELAASANAHLR